MQNHNDRGFVNVGTGVDLPISDLASLISEVTGFQGEIIYDASKPDGMPRKLLDVSRIHAMGWKANIDLREGLKRTYQEIRDMTWN